MTIKTSSPTAVLHTGLLAAALMAAAAGPVQACTSILLPAKDGAYVYGRTMEFALPLRSQLVIIPRNYRITATGPAAPVVGQGGMTWQTKYAAVGANALGLPILVDGVNEKGLAGGQFNFPGYAEFQKAPPGEEGKSIASFELVTYLLTSFATVEEVKAALPGIYVTEGKLKQFGDMPSPYHLSIHDAAGKSIVIEYTQGGQLHVYDNPTHVLTNSPDFPYQLANLAQYQYLTADIVPPLKAGSTSLAAPSSGDGMNGLPGGFLAPARFVRAFFAQQNAPPLDDAAAAVQMSFHLMGGLELPPGSIKTSAKGGGEGGGVDGYEITEWTAAADLRNGRYYIRTYTNPDVRMVDLQKADLNAAAITVIPLDQPQVIRDLTGDAR
jgi:choloylglycine hydrolase